MHEEPTLLLVEGALGSFEYLFPLFHRIDQDGFFRTLQEDHGLTLRFDLFPNGRRYNEPTFFIDLTEVFAGKHQCQVSFTRLRGLWSVPGSIVPDPNVRIAILSQA